MNYFDNNVVTRYEISNDKYTYLAKNINCM